MLVLELFIMLFTITSTIVKLLTVGSKTAHRQIQRNQTSHLWDLSKLFLTEGSFWRELSCNEIWIHHYETESKRQSMEQKQPSLPVWKKFKTGIS